MQIILLTRNLYTTIDDIDYEWVNQYKWMANSCRHGFYASRMEGKKIHYLHRKILNAPDGYVVDHIDQNPLNNCRSNLRLATTSQNLSNQRNTNNGFKNKSSVYRGVVWHKVHKCWHAQLNYMKQRIHIGSFDTEDEAAIAYNYVAKQILGEFAVLNNIKKKRQGI